MPDLAYTTVARVEQLTGQTLTPDQTALAEQVLIGAAKGWIDERAGRAYGAGIITLEAYYNAGPNLWLRSTPVTSIQAVTARASLSDTPETALVAGTTYEARDLTTGWLVLSATYDRVLVSYTPVASVPARVQLAATLLVAHWLQPQVTGVAAGVSSYSVGDLSVTLSAEQIKAGIPAEVLRLVPKRWSLA